MEIKNKIRQIVLAIVCAALLILTLFLGVTAAVYAVGGAKPNLFGTSIYIVKTDAFGLLENGTALIAEQVPYAEIQPGNIVIFSLENNLPAIAEIQESSLSDGVYSFLASTENGDTVTLSQSQIVAKGVSYSNFWGAVITFASSPIGLLLIAVTPCVVLIIIEFVKFLRRAIPEPEIETVKKQLEVPTYTPERGRAAAAYRQAASDSLDDSIGLYDAQVRRSRSVERTDVLEISPQESPLFLGPKHKPIAVQSRQDTEEMPLSQKKLNEAIAAARAARELEDANRRRAEMVREIQKGRSAAIAAEKERENEVLAAQEAERRREAAKPKETAKLPRQSAQPVLSAQSPRSERNQEKLLRRSPASFKSEEEPVKQYTPRKATHATTSIPRLDALLNEDSDDGYNIDDILAGLEQKQF